MEMVLILFLNIVQETDHESEPVLVFKNKIAFVHLNFHQKTGLCCASLSACVRLLCTQHMLRVLTCASWVLIANLFQYTTGTSSLGRRKECSQEKCE